MNIKGTVVHGSALGKQLGYPTANIQTKEGSSKLPFGVYAAKTSIQGKEYMAALALREGKDPEVHLIDFTGDLYGQELIVEVGKKVSDMEKLDTLDELRKKIHSDIEKIKKCFL